MKEELVDKLQIAGVETLQSVLEFMKSGTGFVKEQAPLYVQELLQWGFYDNVISAIVGMILFAPLFIYSFFTWKANLKKSHDTSDPYLLINILMLLICIPLFCAVIVPSIREAVKIKVAPRVYIVETLTKTISK